MYSSSEDKTDIEYGPRGAAKAIKQRNGTPFSSQRLCDSAPIMRAQFFGGLVHEPLDPARTVYVKGLSTDTEADLIQIFQ
jgi:hypothetical protein